MGKGVKALHGPEVADHHCLVVGVSLVGGYPCGLAQDCGSSVKELRERKAKGERDLHPYCSPCAHKSSTMALR